MHAFTLGRVHSDQMLFIFHAIVCVCCVCVCIFETLNFIVT